MDFSSVSISVSENHEGWFLVTYSFPPFSFVDGGGNSDQESRIESERWERWGGEKPLFLIIMLATHLPYLGGSHLLTSYGYLDGWVGVCVCV